MSAQIDPRQYLGADWLGAPIDPLRDPWFRFSRLLSEVESTADFSPGTRWLDLGCHQGQFARLVTGRYGVSVTGVDEWPAQHKSDVGWDYRQIDLATAFDLQGTFDYVSALEVLEHMVDTDLFLDRCRAHLAPGGHLLLTTPNINSLRNRIQVPLGRYPAGLEYRTQIHHVRLYNVSTLESHLTAHGFRIKWLRGVHLLPMGLEAKVRRFVRPASDRAANMVPQLCGDLMVMATQA